MINFSLFVAPSKFNLSMKTMNFRAFMVKIASLICFMSKCGNFILQYDEIDNVTSWTLINVSNGKCVLIRLTYREWILRLKNGFFFLFCDYSDICWRSNETFWSEKLMEINWFRVRRWMVKYAMSTVNWLLVNKWSVHKSFGNYLTGVSHNGVAHNVLAIWFW